MRHNRPAAWIACGFLALTAQTAWATDAFQETAGEVVMEAEAFDDSISRNGRTWTLESGLSGFAGAGYLTALPNTGGSNNGSYTTASPELVFNVTFTTPGTYYVWVRGRADTGNDDSLHAGLDGTGPASADRMDGYNSPGNWVWRSQTLDAVRPTIQITTPGLHTIHLWMREDGMRVDRLLLRTNSSPTAPSGTGPAESARVPVTPPDTTPPGLANVSVTNLTATSATITWTTDEPATSQVEYGTTTGYGSASALDAALVTSHSVALTGLTSSTLYHFRVLSSDAAANPAVSSDGTFTTDVSSDTTPPLISAVSVINVTATSATITWTTDEPATSQVTYGPTTAYGSLTLLDSALVTNHSVTVGGLSGETLYHFQVLSSDAVANAAASSDGTFTTAAPPPPAQQAFQETAGEVVMEAEAFDDSISRNGRTWTLESAPNGFAGAGYLTALPNTGGSNNGSYTTASPELVFNVNFTTPGTYYVWVRGRADTGNDDSIHVGLDAAATPSADRMDGYNSPGAWVWKSQTLDGVRPTIQIATPGLHTIHLWMREDGMRVDRILLRTNSATTAPAGTGPAESARNSNGIPDTTPPLISGVSVTNLTATSATITWTTDEPATSQVEYGTTTGYGSASTLDAALVTSHTITLTTLTPETLHHFRVHSSDAAANPAASTDATFTTAAAGDTTPPLISGVTVSNITDTAATISWITDEPATSRVEYGTTVSYGSASALDAALVTSHSVMLTGLTPEALYHFRVLSTDAAANPAASSDDTFTTAAAGDTTPPLISGVTVSNITDTAATISWITDEPATSQVEYGTTVFYGSASPLNGTPMLSHSVTLTNLTPETLHHFRVHSSDAAANPAASTDATFTTAAPPPPTVEAFQETAGEVVMEAESFDDSITRNNHTWTPESAPNGFAGPGYMTALPNSGSSNNGSYITASPELVFNVTFTTPGTYYVWVRGRGDTVNDDSIHVGLDAAATPSADRLDGYNSSGAWVWKSQTLDGVRPTLQIATPGLHTIHLWMREDGMRVDRLLLRTNSSPTAPSGTGPAQSVRVLVTPPDTTPPGLTNVSVTNLTATGATITWTTDEPATSQVEYGTTTGYGWLLPLDPAQTTTHSMTLNGLSPGVTYHFRVHSLDDSSNAAVSGDGTFTTDAASPTPFAEANGQVVIEAEHYNSRVIRGDDWVLSSNRTGFSGNGYVSAEPNDGTLHNTDYATNSPELIYQVNFTTPGTYYVWVRGLADIGDDDSVHAGVDGAGTAASERIGGFLSSAWVWTNSHSDATPVTIVIPGAGLHTVHLWMREDGLRVDKLLLRLDPSPVPPVNAGPSESSAKPRLMAVGDSITRGSGDSNDFSYRDHLQARLGVGTVEAVGTYEDPESDPVLDVDHEGISGDVTADVEARLPAALAAHLPVPNPAGSRVLLHIGTNDMRNNLPVADTVDNVEDIILLIRAHDPSVAIHVALIVPHRFADVDARITSYNAALLTRLQSLQGTVPNLYIVDMNAAFKQNPNWATQYLADEVHPSDQGYQVMAERWQASIELEP